MNKDKYFIGVDSGSQSTKVIIFNQFGTTIKSVSKKLKPMLHRKKGHVEHPDDDLWDSIKLMLKKITQEFEGNVNDILGVGLCTIRCCKVFMKKDGSLAQPVMSWMDVRAYEKYKDTKEVGYVCPTSAYITHRLTGNLIDSSANAFQYQFPIDTDTWEWSEDEEYFKNFGIPKEKLYKLALPGTIIGHINKQASLETGLPIGVPIVATANDKATEALGSGVIDGQTAFISLGTYIASMVVGDKNVKDSTNFWTNLSCQPHKYLYESNGIRKGMGHISWFKDILGPELYDYSQKKATTREQILEKDAFNIPTGSDGLFTIPDWLAPANELYKKGIMIGFSDLHTRGHIYRSLLEGIVMTLKMNYDSMIKELKINPKAIVIAGGGSNSELLMQMFADCFGVKTIRNQINGSAALGAAMCVAVATKYYDNFKDAVENMVIKKDEFETNQKNKEVYANIIENIFSKLPTHLEDALKLIQKNLK